MNDLFLLNACCVFHFYIIWKIMVPEYYYTVYWVYQKSKRKKVNFLMVWYRIVFYRYRFVSIGIVFYRKKIKLILINILHGKTNFFTELVFLDCKWCPVCGEQTVCFHPILWIKVGLWLYMRKKLCIKGKIRPISLKFNQEKSRIGGKCSGSLQAIVWFFDKWPE